MEEIKQWLHSHQVLPRISFKDRKEHIVEMVKARAESFTNNEGELVDGIKFLVKESGEPKTFFTASQDLLMKLAESKEGEVYKIKMCAKNVGGVVKTYYEVDKVSEDEPMEDTKAEDIPVVESEGTEGERPEDDPRFKEAFGTDGSEK
jgi:hypothetical protein